MQATHKNTYTTLSERNVKKSLQSNCLLVELMSEGKFDELIKHKKAFLRQTMKDYSAGGNDMLDDVEILLAEAKREITENLGLASCLREEDEASWRKECLAMFNAWYEKWFGKP
jgi:ATP-dependent exoDNAse (exonuclease V) alpha subunit